MIGCSVHTDFFDDNCIECKKEYREMKGIGQSTLSNENDECDKATRVHSKMEKYKEFSEERAKSCHGSFTLVLITVVMIPTIKICGYW